MTPDKLKIVLDKHAKWLRGDSDGVQADLRGAGLRWAKLRGADLCGADLRGADLCGADLRWANLRGADLRGADLRWANLRGADLRGAKLCDANLRWANLRGVDLRGADLCDANLRGADLRGADLCGADLCGADLCGADLRGAGIIRIHADYEVTLYPGDPESVLAYGCERHTLSHWDREVEAITRKHEDCKGEEHVARRVAEIRAILALCRTVPQPVRAAAAAKEKQ